MSLNELSSEDVNSFVSGSFSGKGQLDKCLKGKSDTENCIKIIEGLINRAAKLVAANLSAVVLKTGKGKSPAHPVLITVEGTIFYKLHNFRFQFERYFREYLTNERERYVDFKEVPLSSLTGAALAALIN